MRMVQKLGRQDPGDHGITTVYPHQMEAARTTLPEFK